jgi:hypothetical protein
LGIVPFAWENTLAGLHSCWYFVTLFTFVALWGLLCHNSLTWQWWLGAISGLSAFFNIASGILVFPIIIVIKLYLVVVDRSKKKCFYSNTIDHLMTVFISILIAGFCFTLLPQKLHQTQFSHELVLNFSKAMAWPWTNSIYLSLLIYFPFLTLIIKIILQMQKPSRGELFVLGLGGWVILQTISMVSVRGGVAPRYMDILACGIIVNFLAFHFILQTWHSSWVKRSINGYICLWLIIFGYGLYDLMVNTWPAVEGRRVACIEQMQNVRNFIFTGDINTLKNKPFFHIPYPSPEILADRLTNPQLRSILPSSLTSPIPLPANQGGTGMLSMITTYLLENGKVLFFCGLWLLLYLTFQMSKRCQFNHVLSAL